MSEKKPLNQKNKIRQAARPHGLNGTPIKHRYGNSVIIDTCRYRDAYDRNIEASTNFALLVIRDVPKILRPISKTLKNCKKGCRFCPHLVRFNIPGGPAKKRPTAEDLEQMKAHDNLLKIFGTHREMKAYLRSVADADIRLRDIGDFEKRAMKFTDDAIKILMGFFSEEERGGQVDSYDPAFFCRHDLSDAEVCGPYQPLWGMRFDILLSMLRVAYRINRSNLHAYITAVRGPHSEKWNGVLFMSPAGRSTLDVPTWRWVYFFFVRKYGNFMESRTKELRRNGIVYGERQVPRHKPGYRDLNDPDVVDVRKALVSAAAVMADLDAIGAVAGKLLREAKKLLWDTRKGPEKILGKNKKARDSSVK